MKTNLSEIVNKDFYEYLCDTIKGCVKISTIDDVAACKCIVMLGSNLPDAFNKTITTLQNINPEIRVILVSTNKQFMRIPDKLKGIIDWIEWNGNYSEGIYDKLKKHINYPDIDGFFFLGRTPVNMRDMNIYGICNTIKNDHNIIMYMCDYYDLSIYKYEDFDLYCAGIELYQAMNKFIRLVNNYRRLI